MDPVKVPAKFKVSLLSCAVVLFIWGEKASISRFILFLSQQAVCIFYLHKRGAPLGAGPKAGASLASPKGRPCVERINNV